MVAEGSRGPAGSQSTHDGFTGPIAIERVPVTGGPPPLKRGASEAAK